MQARPLLPVLLFFLLTSHQSNTNIALSPPTGIFHAVLLRSLSSSMTCHQWFFLLSIISDPPFYIHIEPLAKLRGFVIYRFFLMHRESEFPRKRAFFPLNSQNRGVLRAKIPSPLLSEGQNTSSCRTALRKITRRAGEAGRPRAPTRKTSRGLSLSEAPGPEGRSRRIPP